MLASAERVSAYVKEDEPIRDVYVREIIVCASSADALYVYESAAQLGSSDAEGVGHLLGCLSALVMVDGPYVRRCEAGRWSRCGQLPVSFGNQEIYYGVILPRAVDAAAR